MRLKVRLNKHGDTKTVKRFALLPVKIIDTWLWLEWYYVTLYYDEYDRMWKQSKKFF